jgi:hypothetical protein
MGNKKKLDADSNVKCITIQFHSNCHNSQSDRWIGLQVYMESLDMLSILG